MSLIQYVGYENDSLLGKAQLIAADLNLQLQKKASSCLFLTAEKLTLKIPEFSFLAADFHATTWKKRKSEGKKQGLVRACKPSSGIKILDATAGWGRDAAILASMGAQVLMVERNPVMGALLTDALAQQTDLDKAELQLSLHLGSAHDYLASLQPCDYPDVIYLDPMHPERSKSALVKKEMQALQQIIGSDDDVLSLLKLAISRVRLRVVVKWPQKLTALLPSNASIAGKTVRFDLYIPA